MGFNPVNKGDFNSLWSVGNSWGEIKITDEKTLLSVKDKPLTLRKFGLKDGEIAKETICDGKKINFIQKENVLEFNATDIKNQLEIIK